MEIELEQQKEKFAQIENSSDKRDRSSKKSKIFQRKIVIRKLPPNLSSVDFLEQIQPLPEINDFYYCKPDWTLGGEATARAYLEFKDEDNIFLFRDKFDGYVFVDTLRGSEYPAVVEYAPFQGMPKSRGRKRDKHMGTIEKEQHFLDFLESLKNEEAENQKSDAPKIEFGYKIKDEQKITSTPLLEFLHAKQQEKRDAKKKKQDDKRRQRDDEKQKKKEKVAQKVPEPIKEAIDEVVYDDGVSVRTVPSRLGRNDKKKDDKHELKSAATEKDQQDKKAARREKELEKEARRKADREKQKQKNEEKKKQQRDKNQERQKNQESCQQQQQPPASQKDEVREKPPVAASSSSKNETKRYSALRKARQDAKDIPVEGEKAEDSTAKANVEMSENPVPANEGHNDRRERAKEKERERLRRKKEEDDRTRRQIRNKDRPTMQIYQPRRRGNEEGGTSENALKSSDEISESNRKKSDSGGDRVDQFEKGEKRDRRRHQKRNSRDENKNGKFKEKRGSKDDGEVDRVAEDLEKVKLDENEPQSKAPADIED